MDSGGVSNFLGQLPPLLYIVFCGSSLALAFALGFIVYSRGKKTRAAAVAGGGAVPMPMMASSTPTAAPGDFPALDDLLNPASLPTESALPPKTSRGGMFTVKLADGGEVEVAEVLTVLRDVAEGGLIIQIGDKAYRNPPALADAEFKRRFNSTLRDLSQNIVSAPAPKPAAPPPAPPTPVADDLPTEAAVLGASNGTAKAPPPMPAPAPVKPPVVAANVPLPGDLPKFKLPDSPPTPPKRGRKPAPEPIPEINIANAIEAFLQHKLSMTPEYSTRNIHVRPASHGGVHIEVDDKLYDTVGDVEDQSVRDFLTSTIAEWQSRQ
jgi:hypothetical protein